MKFLSKLSMLSLLVFVGLVVVLVVHNPAVFDKLGQSSICDMSVLTSERLISVIPAVEDVGLEATTVDTHIYITNVENDEENKGKIGCVVDKVFSTPKETWTEPGKALILHNLATNFTMMFHGDTSINTFDLMFIETGQTAATMWFFHWPNIDTGIEDTKNENTKRGLFLMQTETTPGARDAVLDALTNNTFSKLVKKYENSVSVTVKTLN